MSAGAGGLRVRLRGHVPATAAALTVVSLALVFGAVLGTIPATALPRAPDAAVGLIPHVNAGLCAVAIVTVVAGVRAIRRGNVRRHRALMLGSLGLFAAFLGLYLYRIVLEGPSPFPGPDPVYTYVYLPTLAIHVLLAMVCIPLLYYVTLLALTRPVSEIPRTRHRRVGRVAAALWVISFALGDAVYVMLYLLY